MLKDKMEFQYERRPNQLPCSGCGEMTRGFLKVHLFPRNPDSVIGRRCLNFIPGSRNDVIGEPCCPRCRDTHGKFKEITGFDRSEVTVISAYSSRVGNVSPVPVADQMPPMLARAWKDIRPVGLERTIPVSLDWLACEKYDGVRAVSYWTPEGNFFLGRNKSKGTGDYSDISPNLPHLALPQTKYPYIVLDGELLFSGEKLITGSGLVVETLLNATVVLTNCGPELSWRLQKEYGKLNYVVFDILRLCNTDLRGSEFLRRRAVRDNIVTYLASMGYPVSVEHDAMSASMPSMEFYSSIIATGGEGVIFKDKHAEYCTKPTSRTMAWIKMKRTSTVDGFITGHFVPGEAGNKGLVGSIEVAVYGETGRVVPVAMCSNLEADLRRDLTSKLCDDPDSTSYGLNPDYLLRVVEVEFQERSARCGRGRHARLIRFRPDKDAADCRIETMITR